MSADLNAALAKLREAQKTCDLYDDDRRLAGAAWDFVDAVPEGAVLVAVPRFTAEAYLSGNPDKVAAAAESIEASLQAALEAQT